METQTQTEIIKKQLSLRETKLYCYHNRDAVCKDCLSKITGNVTDIRGNVTDITGNVSGIIGNVSGIMKILKESK